MSCLYIKKFRNKGRGVVASYGFKKGQLIERTPMLVIPKNQTKHIDLTVIADYWFDCDGRGAIALGLTSLLNHSNAPNVDWWVNVKKQILTFKAIRDIKPNEELTINYNYDKWLWKPV